MDERMSMAMDAVDLENHRAVLRDNRKRSLGAAQDSDDGSESKGRIIIGDIETDEMPEDDNVGIHVGNLLVRNPRPQPKPEPKPDVVIDDDDSGNDPAPAAPSPRARRLRLPRGWQLVPLALGSMGAVALVVWAAAPDPDVAPGFGIQIETDTPFEAPAGKRPDEEPTRPGLGDR